jgi:hypothetical protein
MKKYQFRDYDLIGDNISVMSATMQFSRSRKSDYNQSRKNAS